MFRPASIRQCATVLAAFLHLFSPTLSLAFGDDASDGDRNSKQLLSADEHRSAFADYHHGNRRSDSLGSRYITHFSTPIPETSTFLYDLFRPTSKRALAYTVTSTPSTHFYRYLFASENANHVDLKPLKDEETIKLKVYLPPAKKRAGEGVIGMDIKFAAWELSWRGVEMEVYLVNWIENGFNRKSQTHLTVNFLPTNWQAPSSLAQALVKDKVTPSHNDAERAAELFLLEVGQYASQLKDAILVFDQAYWQEDRALWENVQKANWSDVILAEEMKAALKHEYKSFFKSEKVYTDLGVPWKRGVIFLGPPGNGKTISLKAIMKDAGVAVLYVKSLHTYGGDELGIRMVFERARQEAPCLLVFEDVDALITDNNRAFFLNEVDGLEDNDGLLLVGTTNHFDRLDPALSNRPSRFDRKYFFPNPNEKERAAYATYWQNKLADNSRVEFPASLVEEFASKTYDFSFAYMKEAFVSALLLLAGDEEERLAFPATLLQQVESLRKDLEKGDDEDANDSSTTTTTRSGPAGRMFGSAGRQQSVFRIHPPVPEMDF